MYFAARDEGRSSIRIKVADLSLHVLLVEDDDDFVDEVTEVFKTIPGNHALRIARSRTEAYETLKEGFIDLAILDLKIPTVSGALDADPEHGHAVFRRVRAEAPGTPILVLTGSHAEDFFSSLLSQSHQRDIWSEGTKTGTIRFLKKIDFDNFLEMLTPIANAIEHLSEVELERQDIELSVAEDRLIRIFARRFHGKRCIVTGLGGGLSGARVIRLIVTNWQGVRIHDAVAKLSSHAMVEDEGDRYDKHVTRLPPAATPRKLATMEFGAHKLAGVFFGLAEGFDESAFDIAGNADSRSASVVGAIANATSKWIEGVPETRKSVGDIRRRLLNDDSCASLCAEYDLNWVDNFETREIQARWACSHGDLHGCNVLVSRDNRATLIDYGDVGEGPASLDPVTLELSIFFHPSAPKWIGSWPTLTQTKMWGDLSVFLEGCPFPVFVRECRTWALQVAAGKREVAASAYSYLLRQLKYENTDKQRVLNLLAGIRRLYDGDT